MEVSDTDCVRDFEMKAALAEYTRHEDKDKFWTKFDIDKVTWKDVADELQKVEAIYQDQGVGNPLRRAFRRGAAYSNTAASLLEAIPNDDGLGLLKGALLVVLKVRVLKMPWCPDMASKRICINRDCEMTTGY